MIALGLIVMVLSCGVLAQALFSLYLMLYTWWQPERLEASRSPQSFAAPRRSFTVLLPARHEQAVIAETIRRILRANYPDHLIEILVICEAGDGETIREAERAFAGLPASRGRVLTFDDGPINKPHGLNVGLRAATNDVVTIFDAEDDVHADIFNVINTVMLHESVRIVQAGVQLMNHTTNWFSGLNVMEYYFWFRSRLHFHARVGMIPLGGNTVFIARELLERVGGWDETCLTEDADIGVRLSVLGEPIRVVYDAAHVTREETPSTIESFVRQRTRWNQGFMQVLAKRDWLRLPTFGQKALAAYTLSGPIFQGLQLALWPAALLVAIFVRLPVPIVLPSLLPLYGLLFVLLLNLFGLWEFTRLYRLRFPITLPLRLAIAYLPFNFALSYSAFRAAYRYMRNLSNWEKTQHLGAHRT